jgi:hypothetical protein
MASDLGNAPRMIGLLGDPYLAAGLFVMGLLGASSLAMTIYRMPQVRKLRELGRYASSRIDE